jgi:hypothetical protein
MTKVYLLWHVRDVAGQDEEKLIGVYSTEDNAKQTIQRLQRQPGFKDFPYCFQIFDYDVDPARDGWSEGFTTVPRGSPRSRLC